MLDEQKAIALFEKMCRMLEDRKIKFQTDGLTATVLMKTQDLPICLIIKVDSECAELKIESPLPFYVPEQRRTDVALAVNFINGILVDGCFEFNMMNGAIDFRLSNTVIGCELSEEAIKSMFHAALFTVDDFNEKLFGIACNRISIGEFLEEQTHE